MKQETIRVHRWTRREYERTIDAGICRPGERVELLGGPAARV